MPRSLFINANPKILYWARRNMEVSVDEAAIKLKVSREHFIDFEKGARKITLRQARLLTELYEVSIASFYLPIPPEDIKLPPDYRSAGPKFTKKTMLAFRKALKIRESYLELLKLIGEKPKKASIDLTKSVESDSALKLRGLLGLTKELQTAKRDPEGLFNFLKSKLESFGILVLELSFPTSECKGFSYSDIPTTIVVNRRGAYQAKLFTLAHELSHIISRSSSICSVNPFKDFKVEQQCNQFAARFLIPERDILPMIKGLSLDEETIKEFAVLFNVSKYAMLFRFYDLSLLGNNQKVSLYAKWLKDDQKISPFFTKGRPEKRTMRENGSLYTKLVFDAYHNSLINYGAISRYLGINPTLVNAIGEGLGV